MRAQRAAIFLVLTTGSWILICTMSSRHPTIRAAVISGQPEPESFSALLASGRYFLPAGRVPDFAQ